MLSAVRVGVPLLLLRLPVFSVRRSRTQGARVTRCEGAQRPMHARGGVGPRAPAAGGSDQPKAWPPAQRSGRARHARGSGGCGAAASGARVRAHDRDAGSIAATGVQPAPPAHAAEQRPQCSPKRSDGGTRTQRRPHFDYGCSERRRSLRTDPADPGPRPWRPAGLSADERRTPDGDPGDDERQGCADCRKPLFSGGVKRLAQTWRGTSTATVARATALCSLPISRAAQVMRSSSRGMHRGSPAFAAVCSANVSAAVKGFTVAQTSLARQPPPCG
jgi:hypothetical protein